MKDLGKEQQMPFARKALEDHGTTTLSFRASSRNPAANLTRTWSLARSFDSAALRSG